MSQTRKQDETEMNTNEHSDEQPRPDETTEESAAPVEAEEHAPAARDPLSDFVDDPEGIAPVADAAAAPEDLQQAQARIAELEVKLEEANDKMLRAMAEADNTRRRAEKERHDVSRFAVSDFARKMLEVGDNLRRALDSIPEEARAESEQMANIYAGVEATERILMKAMETSGIVKIDPENEVFNPNFHEVMFEVDNPDVPPGTVVQVLEPGYMIHERLLRPARVSVAKGGKPAKESRVDTEA